MNKTLNAEQKVFVNKIIRQGLEHVVRMRYYLDALVSVIDNQQYPIVADTEVLNDDRLSDAPRADAPQLQGVHIKQLRDLAAGMRDQISAENTSALSSLMVRDLNTVIRNALSPLKSDEEIVSDLGR